MYYAIIIILILAIWAYLSLLFFFKNKIEKFEEKIKLIFEKKSGLVPCLKISSKDFVEKQDLIFSHLISLRKKQLSTRKKDFINFLDISAEIEHEIGFISKVISENPNTEKSWETLYIIDKINEISIKIDKNMEIYKKIIASYNKLISFKNLTIIWFFLHFPKK